MVQAPALDIATQVVATPPVLLTPGPLTTAMPVRRAALTDWGSWDNDFNQVTSQVLAALLRAAGAKPADRLACVPLQGSGTFALEAAVRTFVPTGDGLVIGVNGAYGERLARLTAMAGRRVRVVEHPWHQPISAERLVDAMSDRHGFTNVGIVHCETSTGLLNDLGQIADTVGAVGGRLIVDAMSTFGALDVLPTHPAVRVVVAASGKCIEGLPGVGFVICSEQTLALAKGQCDSLSLDLAEQYAYMQRTGQWRFTPPTHLVAALAAALAEYEQAGGRPSRLARYRANSAALAHAAAGIGLVSYLPKALQAPIIHTFYAPDGPDWSFDSFYDLVKQQGFILYPGKLTAEETFRVGCIGQVTPHTMRQAVRAIDHALKTMGIDLSHRLGGTP